ncbi:Ribose transport system permease protein RbsC [Pseudovibrio axinellae]|uniref:Ribose transport system permease protein RbsC n=1 Tax=Pseudovibrio axinellae TaxID=989403 RepID=A0A165UN25_9HYPH|nr:ribose ABC transporter permease [Pseudovibrio axinellae]KZL12590.1 Ribose transport system permease protein RbsC [Pseudovibrio axinellae]SEP65456.1 ribose ABC transporter membrane protein [Pseudovibrio axinellae]
MKLNDFISENKSLIGLIILMAAVSFANANFLGVDNMLNILRQTSINAVIAMGMTFVILTSGIDLSVGSILAFAGAICASLIGMDTPLVVALFATIMVGAGLGATSGVIISYFNVQPFIATLVGMTMIRGATLVYTQGRPVSTGSHDVAESFYQFGAGYIFGIPHPVILMIVIFAICWFILSQTRFGRYVYAIGGNENVARLSGINVKKVKILVYALSGALAALAGIILTARLESAQPTAGLGYELDAIAAVVLGGTSLAGGKGRVFGTIIGALIIGVLNNALNIMDVSSYYQMIAKGAVILLAVVVDSRGKANA